MKDHQYKCLAGGYDLEIGHFLEVARMVATWWIVAFFAPCLLSGVATDWKDTSQTQTHLYTAQKKATICHASHF